MAIASGPLEARASRDLVSARGPAGGGGSAGGGQQGRYVSSVGEAAAALRAGGLVAFPTETVYGLGAHALDAAAVTIV